MKYVLQYLKEHRLVSGITVLALTQFLASVAGLVRDNFLSATFPVTQSGVVDAYLAAFRPSDLLFQTCVMSAMGTVLVPVLAGYKTKGNTYEMQKVLNGTVGTAAIVFGVVALILGIFLPQIAPLLVAFPSQETMTLYVNFGRIALLTNFLFVFGNAYGQYLITVQRYWVYGITPILYTLGTIVGTVFLTPYFGVYGPIMGTLLGACIYTALRLGAVIYNGGRIFLSFWHPDIREMGRLMLPRILSFGAFQFQLLFLDRLASGLPTGSVTINNFARNFQSVLVGVIGISVAQAVYSMISQTAAQKDRRRFAYYVRYGTIACLAFTIPGSIALVALSPVAAWLVHLQPVFHAFAITLMIYAVSVPFESLTHIQYRAFYAMRNTLVPSVFGVLGGIAAIVTAALLIRAHGIYAVAVGFTVGEIVQVLGLGLVLPWQTNAYMGTTAEELLESTPTSPV